MKLKLTYIPGEEREAAAVLAALLQLFPGAKARKRDKHPPYRHIYVTIPERKPPAAVGGSLDKAAPSGV